MSRLQPPSTPSIRAANLLERDGKIDAAIRLNAQIARAFGVGNLIGDLARANASRLERRGKAQEPESTEATPVRGSSVLPDTLPALCAKHPAGWFFESQRSAKAPLSRPLVTVVIPSFNCERYLGAAAESALSQSYARIEIVIVDDHSTDASAKLAKSIAARDKRVRFIQHRCNGGLASARNTGLRSARGEFICFLDSDDLLAPTSVDLRAARLMQFRPHRHIVGVYDQSITLHAEYDGVVAPSKTKLQRHYADFINSFGDCPFNANQPMLKRSLLMSLGGFPEKYPQAEDWRLWSKALRAGYVFVALDTIGSGYRQTPGSMIRRAPLVHVEKSRSNFFRAHASYDSETSAIELAYETRFFASPYFKEPVGVYEGWRRFLPRFLNFCGIDYARQLTDGHEPQPRLLAEYIRQHFADFPAIFTGSTPANARSWFAAGIRRYVGEADLDAGLLRGAEEHIHQVLEILGLSFAVQPTIGPERALLPARTLHDRECESVDILFVPHKEYHSRSFAALLPLLRAQGLSFRFVDISVPYRQEGARIPDVEGDMLSYNEFALSRILPRVIVCMNDWDTVVRPLVERANEAGIATVGIVEGVQDYHDADTGRQRNAYRTVRNVFLPGDFDRRYFTESRQTLVTIGVQRLEGLEGLRKRRGLSRGGRRRLVLNVNFSYGVLTDRRAAWVEGVAEVCRRVGFELIVSQHPQDDGDLSRYRVSKEPLYDLIASADVFVSRFSGAILEALAIGCPVVYYNAHREKVDKFFESLGAYQVADSREQLEAALTRLDSFEADSAEFLRLHAAYGQGSIAERTVDALAALVHKSAPDPTGRIEFRRRLVFA